MTKHSKEKTSSKEISWKAPEFFHFHKEDSWYLISLLISGAFLGIAIWQKNFFFAVFIVIAEALVLHFAHQKPRTLEFKITEQGIDIEGDKLYLFKGLQSFWLRQKLDDLDELVIKTRSYFKSHLKIFLPPSKTEGVREMLRNYLPEEEHEDSLIELLSEWIGF